jgi:hypothetical protein
MIEKLVKNRTPYLGKMILKFEKHPHYSSSMDGRLNKVHLNLGFTKLVTRLIPNQVMEGYSNIDPKKIELINKYTGGIIGTYKWGDNDNDEFVLEDSFLTKDGKYIGNIDTAWWYFQNAMTVCEEYPQGVAIVWNTTKCNTLACAQTIKGYRGYSHRGGATFKIGDRLFDEEYNPVVEDYDENEFKKWWKEYTKSYKNGDDFDKKWIYGDGIKSVIPFNKRGKNIIENLEDARTAAINMSKYLS